MWYVMGISSWIGAERYGGVSKSLNKRKGKVRCTVFCGMLSADFIKIAGEPATEVECQNYRDGG
jgi:hypothetical protein